MAEWLWLDEWLLRTLMVLALIWLLVSLVEKISRGSSPSEIDRARAFLPPPITRAEYIRPKIQEKP
jgi:hypothetical protein